MGQYMIKRLLLTIPLLLGVSLVLFVMVDVLPGDPVSVIFGKNPMIPPDPAVVAQMRAHYGLDEPIFARYVHFVGNLVRGDLGVSIMMRRPVVSIIAEHLPATIGLALASVFVAVLIAIPLGTIAAVHQNTWWDHATQVGALLGVSMPNFWLALVLMMYFSVNLRWFPLFGTGSWEYGVWDVLSHLILPAITLGTSLAALLTRLTRASVGEVLRQEHVRTAQAKGLSRWRLVVRHGLRNATVPILTVIGLQFGYLLGGSVIVETIFSWPGMGRVAIDAIWDRDLPVIQGAVLTFTLLFIVTNLLVDLVYAYLDPRIRYD